MTGTAEYVHYRDQIDVVASLAGVPHRVISDVVNLGSVHPQD